jgi:outer membrane biosynthesis protein TonB
MSQSHLTSAEFEPTTAREPRVGIAGALVLHGAILAAALFTFQHKFDPVDQATPIIPVDLVTFSQKTNIMPTVAHRQVVEHHEDIQPPAPAPPTIPAPPVPKPPPIAEPAPEPAPIPKPLLQKPTPTPKPVAEKPAPDVKPVQKLAEAKPVKKPSTDDFSALLNKLTTPTDAPTHARAADRTVKGVGAMNAMTADLVDALKNQIAQCWSPPVGAPNPEQLIPTFRVFLNPDGSVSQAPQLSAASQARAASNPYMRAAADAARRAIMTCQPYKLPGDKYNTWRDVTIDFDPRQMIQQ